MSLDKLSEREIEGVRGVYGEMLEALQYLKGVFQSKGVTGSTIKNHERLEYRAKVMVDIFK